MPDNPTHIGPALGDEDWRQLDALNLSQNPDERAQGAAISQKLTFGEQKDFAAYQQKVRPKGTNDTTAIETPIGSVGGDMLALGGMQLGNAVSGATSVAGKALAGLKAATSQGGSVIKYEIAKGALQHFGVPYYLAGPLAYVFSGYRFTKGGPTAAPAEALPTAAPTPTETPMAPSVPEPVRQAYTKARAAATPASAPVPATPAAEVPSESPFTAAEMDQAKKWAGQGVSHETILQRILASRALRMSTPGFVDPDTVKQEVEYMMSHGGRRQQ
jgi:hypothetical protein